MIQRNSSGGVRGKCETCTYATFWQYERLETGAADRAADKLAAHKRSKHKEIRTYHSDALGAVTIPEDDAGPSPAERAAIDNAAAVFKGKSDR